MTTKTLKSPRDAKTILSLKKVKQRKEKSSSSDLLIFQRRYTKAYPRWVRSKTSRSVSRRFLNRSKALKEKLSWLMNRSSLVCIRSWKAT